MTTKLHASKSRRKTSNIKNSTNLISSQKSVTSYTSLLSTANLSDKISSNQEPNYRDIEFKEIMNNYYKPQSLAVMGFIASVVCSFSLPMFGFVLANYMFVLSMYDGANTDPNTYYLRNIWTIAFVVLCLGIGLSAYFQKLYFGRGGENLTNTLRIKLFEAYLHKHIGWFDNKMRAPGILTNILTEDISAVNGLTTESLGIAVEAALGLFFSCLICFIFSWQLGFVVTATSPFMVLGGLGMSKLQFNQKAVDDSYKQANALLNDLIINYRTVISFGQKNVD